MVAETQLANSTPGQFIIRPTTHGKDGEFSISVRFNKSEDISHFKLIKEPGKLYWKIWGDKYKTLQDFVKKFQEKPIENKNKDKICLDSTATVEVIVADENDYMDTYYYDDGEYEDAVYEDVSVLNEKEERDQDQHDIIEGSIVRSTHEFIKKEEGTISVKPGDRLMVLHASKEGWVYVSKENEEGEGYVPDKILSIEKR